MTPIEVIEDPRVRELLDAANDAIGSIIGASVGISHDYPRLAQLMLEKAQALRAAVTKVLS